MDAPTPTRKPTDLVELIFAPQGEPNSQVLAQLAEVIREGVELARKQGSPKINPKKWEPADPDAAPTSLTEAIGQAEDAILDIAAASQQRAKELAEQVHRPETRKQPGFWSRAWAVLLRPFRRSDARTERKDDPIARMEAAEKQLKETVEKLARMGIVVVAEATEPSSVQR